MSAQKKYIQICDHFRFPSSGNSMEKKTKKIKNICFRIDKTTKSQISLNQVQELIDKNSKHLTDIVQSSKIETLNAIEEIRLRVLEITKPKVENEAGEEVSLKTLAAKNLAKGRLDVLKVLGDGELSKKLKISAHRFSKSAAEKIEKAGGEMVVLPGKTPVKEKQRAAKQAKASS